METPEVNQTPGQVIPAEPVIPAASRGELTIHDVTAEQSDKIQAAAHAIITGQTEAPNPLSESTILYDAVVAKLQEFESRVKAELATLEATMKAEYSHVVESLTLELRGAESRIKAIEGRFVAEVKEGAEDVKSEAQILEGKVVAALTHIGADVKKFF